MEDYKNTYFHDYINYMRNLHLRSILTKFWFHVKGWGKSLIGKLIYSSFYENGPLSAHLV